MINTENYEFHLIERPYSREIETITDKCMMPVFDALVKNGYMPIMQSNKTIIVSTFDGIENVLRSLDQHTTVVKNRCSTFNGIMICFVFIGIVMVILIDTNILTMS